MVTITEHNKKNGERSVYVRYSPIQTHFPCQDAVVAVYQGLLTELYFKQNVPQVLNPFKVQFFRIGRYTSGLNQRKDVNASTQGSDLGNIFKFIQR